MSALLRPSAWFEEMREDDVPAVMAVERRIYAFPWTGGNFRDSIHAGYACRLYRDAEGLIGYSVATVAAGEAHILNLSVAAERQRMGNGARLLAHMIGLARAQRAASVFLEVRPSNEAALNLYRGCGFRRIGMRRGYYPGASVREDALVLALEL
ncbi:MAG: ribosomal protein S18-alanine N-acetyltransferase [Burkholderiales bacterium]|nr:ribosomal protein S18-alanine N-acetyltransferase [Burkholderiales bacterium]